MNAEERVLKQKIVEASAALLRHKANLKFASLPAPQKRIAVAQDVLAMLALPFKKRPSVASTYVDVHIEGDVTQETLCTNPSACTVCGIGSLMLAHFRMFDNVPGNNAMEDLGFMSISERLGGYFSNKQLAVIEAAFEGDCYINLDRYYEITPKMENSVEKWASYHPKNRTLRLRAIMQNLIRNGGTFKIEQGPHTA